MKIIFSNLERISYARNVFGESVGQLFLELEDREMCFFYRLRAELALAFLLWQNLTAKVN